MLIISEILTNKLSICLGKLFIPFKGLLFRKDLFKIIFSLLMKFFILSKIKLVRKSGWLAIKLDMEMAYDRLE